MMDELKPCPSQWDAAVKYLNIYRNSHYNDSNVDDSYWLAQAINEILPFAVNAHRRHAPENNPLTLDELLSMDGEPAWSDWASWVIVNVVSKSNVEFVYRDGSKNDYEELVELGTTPVLYKQIPEGIPKCKTNTKGTKINSAACKVLQAWAKSLEYSEPEESEN